MPSSELRHEPFSHIHSGSILFLSLTGRSLALVPACILEDVIGAGVTIHQAMHSVWGGFRVSRAFPPCFGLSLSDSVSDPSTTLAAVSSNSLDYLMVIHTGSVMSHVERVCRSLEFCLVRFSVQTLACQCMTLFDQCMCSP